MPGLFMQRPPAPVGPTGSGGTRPLLAVSRVWRRTTALAALLLWAGAAPIAARAADEHRLVQSQLGLHQVLHGIISYTTWPAGQERLLLCVTRGALDGPDIARQMPALRGGRQLAVSLVDADEALPADCDAAYLDGWSAQALRATLRSVASRPVLTMGRGADFCSDGGMFCLERDNGSVRFEVNLDAVARSGLRVHPQVLRLARPGARGSS